MYVACSYIRRVHPYYFYGTRSYLYLQYFCLSATCVTNSSVRLHVGGHHVVHTYVPRVYTFLGPIDRCTNDTRYGKSSQRPDAYHIYLRLHRRCSSRSSLGGEIGLSWAEGAFFRTATTVLLGIHRTTSECENNKNYCKPYCCT